MGDRFATMDMDQKEGRKRGGAVPLSREGAGPHLTQCRLGQDLPPYQVTSSSVQPFGHTTWAESGEGAASAFFLGEPSRHLTQCGLDEAYLHTKWHFNPSSRLTTTE